MRTTQYIGLTNDAQEWVESAIEKRQVQICVGMFDEPVMGNEYVMPPPRGPNKALIAREEVQLAPWSSGPMIFTHFKLILVKQTGQEIDAGHAFSWVLNPSLAGTGQEYNPEKGHYYV